MNLPSSFDRETLQQFLANAFAVQQSQINARSLSDIMEVQRSVRSGKLSLDAAMRHIVESARAVANATGVAIALIDGEHLRYGAGSGSSAVCIGWRVAASLTVCATTRTNREILRVEDAQTDTRIEADICRQFGANSLLILPIYFQGAVAGVLDVRFSEPHAFQEPEVRTYRLMAEQIEAALSHTAQPGPKENLASKLPPIPEAFEPVSAADENFIPVADDNFALPPHEDVVPPPDFMMLPENEHSLYARCGALLADIMDLPVFKQSVWLARLLTQQAKHIHLPRRPRRSPQRLNLIAARFAQRARNSTWQGRWWRSSLDTARGLSARLQRSTLRAAVLAQRAKNLTWPDSWRRSSLGAARDLSSRFRRSASRVAVFAQRVENSSWPDRWRRSSSGAARELLSVLKRLALVPATFAQRAKTANWLNERRRLALEVIVVVLAFTTLIVYRGRVPAKLLESSTQSNSSATVNQPEQQPKPLPGRSASQVQSSLDPQAFLDPQGSLIPSSPKSKQAGPALKQVQRGPNEVDYVADDVTMRVFTNKSAAKRNRPPNTRVAQFGDDVTVRYFAPPLPSSRAASR